MKFLKEKGSIRLEIVGNAVAYFGQQLTRFRMIRKDPKTHLAILANCTEVESTCSGIYSWIGCILQVISRASLDIMRFK